MEASEGTQRAAMDEPLRFLVVLGSVRDSTPPRPARLGLRVGRAMVSALAGDGHGAELIDPLHIVLPRPFKPHFAYAAGEAPEPLEALAARFAAADGYVMVSPEYNHSMSPALADFLNHFGSSLFSFKPSAIVTYSAGQWGGVRAAVAMRPFLSELGCLPVSAMIHVPAAAEVLDSEGRYIEGVDAARWGGYVGRTLAQLAWWAAAARAQRALTSGSGPTPAFSRTPTERNSPSA